MTAFGPARREDFATAVGLVASTKPELAGTFDFGRSVGRFHEMEPLKYGQRDNKNLRRSYVKAATLRIQANYPLD